MSASVLLPLPEGPTSATVRPGSSRSDTSLSTGGPPGYANDTPSNTRSRVNVASTAPGGSTSARGRSSSAPIRSRLASAWAQSACTRDSPLKGEVSRSDAMRKTMMTCGVSGLSRPSRPGCVPA